MSENTTSDYGIEAPQKTGVATNAERYRLDPSSIAVAAMLVVLKVVLGKPLPNSIFKIHPDPTWRFIALMLRSQSDYFVVNPSLRYDLEGLVSRRILVPGITTRGNLFLWPIKLPNDRGQLDSWNEVAAAAAEKSASSDTWMRIGINDEGDGYVVRVYDNDTPAAWPADLTFDGMIDLAFKDRTIDNLEHPAIKELFINEARKMAPR